MSGNNGDAPRLSFSPRQMFSETGLGARNFWEQDDQLPAGEQARPVLSSNDWSLSQCEHEPKEDSHDFAFHRSVLNSIFSRWRFDSPALGVRGRRSIVRDHRDATTHSEDDKTNVCGWL
jgi:hypothetical protein